jgi:ferredoxin
MDASVVAKKKTRKVAVVQPWCTGCSGTPVCVIYCRKNALMLIKDSFYYPFNIMTVDESACIGCGACVTKGENGISLSGCPWNAIRMVTVSLSQTTCHD